MNDHNQGIPTTADPSTEANQQHAAGACSCEEFDEERCQLINGLLDREEANCSTTEMESKSKMVESSVAIKKKAEPTKKAEQRVSSKRNPTKVDTSCTSELLKKEELLGVAQLDTTQTSAPDVDETPGAWSIVGRGGDQADEDENDDQAATEESILVPEASVVLTELESIQICMAACDGCRGWSACKDLCLPDATFSCQADTLAHIKTVQEYADFFYAFGKACPNASWTTHNTQWCPQTHTATLVCTYHCTHSQSLEGVGPLTPTHKTSHTDYIYNVQTDPNQGYKIKHITKIWNDKWCLRDLGWLPDEEGAQSKESNNASTTDAPVPMKETEDTSATFAGDAPCDHSSAMFSSSCSIGEVVSVAATDPCSSKAKKKKSMGRRLKHKLQKLVGYKSNKAN